MADEISQKASCSTAPRGRLSHKRHTSENASWETGKCPSVPPALSPLPHPHIHTAALPHNNKHLTSRWRQNGQKYGPSRSHADTNTLCYGYSLLAVLYDASRAFLVAQRLKRLPAVPETRVRYLSQEDPLEKEMAAHSSTLAWRIPWTEEPGGLQSTGSQRVGHD